MPEQKQREKSDDPSEEKAHNEQSYSIASLRAHCTQLFGIMPEVFDGALYGVQEAELTKYEVNQKIIAFLQREVP